MDYRLEPVDKLLATSDLAGSADVERELHFALESVDFAESTTLYWLAACAAARAAELKSCA